MIEAGGAPIQAHATQHGANQHGARHTPGAQLCNMGQATQLWNPWLNDNTLRRDANSSSPCPAGLVRRGAQCNAPVRRRPQAGSLHEASNLCHRFRARSEPRSPRYVPRSSGPRVHGGELAMDGHFHATPKRPAPPRAGARQRDPRRRDRTCVPEPKPARKRAEVRNSSTHTEQVALHILRVTSRTPRPHPMGCRHSRDETTHCAAPCRPPCKLRRVRPTSQRKSAPQCASRRAQQVGDLAGSGRALVKVLGFREFVVRCLAAALLGFAQAAEDLWTLSSRTPRNRRTGCPT